MRSTCAFATVAASNRHPNRTSVGCNRPAHALPICQHTPQTSRSHALLDCLADAQRRKQADERQRPGDIPGLRCNAARLLARRRRRCGGRHRHRRLIQVGLAAGAASCNGQESGAARWPALLLLRARLVAQGRGGRRTGGGGAAGGQGAGCRRDERAESCCHGLGGWCGLGGAGEAAKFELCVARARLPGGLGGPAAMHTTLIEPGPIAGRRGEAAGSHLALIGARGAPCGVGRPARTTAVA